jgi:V8-like Glu-specific endopeptidase
MARDKQHFAGSIDGPTPLTEVVSRIGIRGRGERPAELVDLASYRSILIRAEDGEPQFDVVTVGDHREGLFEIRTRIDERQSQVHLIGRTADRMPMEKYLGDIDDAVSFDGFKPDWADALFSPRLLPQRELPMLRKFNRRPVEPLEVFGQDDRWQFRDAAWPWGLIGRIFTSDGFSGSGVLIGDRTVVTAGHMVPWGKPGWWMRFVPAYYDGSSLHGGSVESYVSDARGFDVGGEVAGYDFAVLRLYQPLGSWLGYMGYNGYSESWNDRPYWSIVGYPGAVAGGTRPSFQNSISIWDVDNDSNGGRELESQTADLTPGNSGGPMFAWWGSDPRVVGVVSGAESDWSFPFSWDRSNVMAGGPGFTNLVAWARTNWPA